MSCKRCNILPTSDIMPSSGQIQPKCCFNLPPLGKRLASHLKIKMKLFFKALCIRVKPILSPERVRCYSGPCWKSRSRLQMALFRFDRCLSMSWMNADARTKSVGRNGIESTVQYSITSCCTNTCCQEAGVRNCHTMIHHESRLIINLYLHFYSFLSILFPTFFLFVVFIHKFCLFSKHFNMKQKMTT